MTARAADALVFFGATGDLAYRKIFPALQELARRGRLAVPVIGVARDDTLDDLRTRARESVESQARVDQSAFERLMGLLHYVSGDYTDPGTFDRLRRELGDAARPKRRGSRRRGDGSAHCQVDRDRSSAKVRCHPERSEGAIPRGPAPSLRSG
jgi:glucose-6-phosphate 1-dehydrogenase